MQIILTVKEVEHVIHTALCNALGTGYMTGHGLLFDKEATNYSKYRAEGDCLEEVIMKALKAGEAFHMVDDEGDDDEYNASFTLTQAKERLKAEAISNNVMNIINEEDDAEDADCILQWCLYEDIVFG